MSTSAENADRLGRRDFVDLVVGGVAVCTVYGVIAGLERLEKSRYFAGPEFEVPDYFKPLLDVTQGETTEGQPASQVYDYKALFDKISQYRIVRSNRKEAPLIKSSLRMIENRLLSPFGAFDYQYSEGGVGELRVGRIGVVESGDKRDRGVSAVLLADVNGGFVHGLMLNRSDRGLVMFVYFDRPEAPYVSGRSANISKKQIADWDKGGAFLDPRPASELRGGQAATFEDLEIFNDVLESGYLNVSLAKRLADLLQGQKYRHIPKENA
jgi:hypothetical protein